MMKRKKMGFGKGFIRVQRLRYEGTFEHGNWVLVL
jgi:hypothetical protein